MDVHLIGDVGLSRLCLIAGRLLRGRFEGPGTRSWTVSRVSVTSDRTFLIERDGEVIRTRAAGFRVLPGAIQLCT
jgi:diacylglycerol kinase family enzyme